MKKALVLFAILTVSLGFASDLEERAAAFLESLASGKHEEVQEMLSESLKDVLAKSGRTLGEVWKSVEEMVGKFVRIDRKLTIVEHGFSVVYVGCEFEGALLDARIVFDQNARILEFVFLPYVERRGYRIPEYVDLGSFEEFECVIGEGKWRLPATLSLPKGEGPFPAVVLVPGSGPVDRDVTQGPNKPFRDIAWGLASKGIAVLRFDKRTKVYPEECAKILNEFTVREELVEDAMAAIEYLRKHDKVDRNRIYLLGHSLGGTMAPRIALETRELAGLILLAPAARGFYLVNLLRQVEYLFSLDGVVDEDEERQLRELAEQIERIRRREIGESEIVFGASKVYWEDLLDYDPIETARSLEVPILILQGTRDYQVTVEDFLLWKEGLKDKPNVAFMLFEGLNHLFIFGEGLPTPFEYYQPGNVSPEVVEDIAWWILSR